MGKHTGKSKQPKSDSEYQEFKKKVYALLGHVPDRWMPDTDTLYVEWCVGGVTGGSCWDTGEGPDPHHSVSSEPEPAFEYLDTILESMYPEITFLQYRILERKCVSTKDRHQSEYYGNYYEYRQKILDLRKLHEFLSELKKNAED